MKLYKKYVGILFSIITLFLLSGCNGLFYQPNSIYYITPESQGLLKQDIDFKSKDGTEVHGWFFPAQPQQTEKGVIIQFHGNAQNRSAHYLSLVWLTQHGYSLFTFDYRGYGDSSGKPSRQGVYEDGLAALEQAWILKKNKNSKFIVYGQSLGGAIATAALKNFSHQNETDLFVADSTFVSYKKVANLVLRKSWLTWILSPLAYVLVSDQLAPEDILPQLRVPTLVIHDESDPVVPFDQGKLFYDLSQNKVGFWTENKKMHIAFFSADKSKENQKRFLNTLQSLPR